MNGIKRRRGQRRSSAFSQPLTVMLTGLVLVASVLFIGLASLFMWMHQQKGNTTVTTTTLREHLTERRDTGIKVPPTTVEKKKVVHSIENVVNNNNIVAAAANNNNIEPKLSHLSPNEYPYPLEILPPETLIAGPHYKPKGPNRFTEYTNGDAPYTITDDLRKRSDEVARSRRGYIKQAMQFTWQNYQKYAMGKDELLPQSGKGNDNWGGQGITLVDSLDTLWLMDMKDEFNEAKEWVRTHLDHSKVGTVSLFETTIRDLGGLLSAYDWSRDVVFLEKALDLGKRLFQAYTGTSTGIPFGQVNLANGMASNIAWAGGQALVAEFGTIQLENRYLSKMTGHAEYGEKSERIIEILHEIAPSNGLFPYYVNNNPRRLADNLLKDGMTPRPVFTNDKITFGAMGDSLYEYFLKTWLQGGKTEPMYRELYDHAIDSMHTELLQRSTPSGLYYIADKEMNKNRLHHKMDHLACFMGGTLALGAYTDPLGVHSARAQRDLKTARGLTYTCYQMYARMNTGISPEFIQFEDGKDFLVGRGAPHYLLRPEAFESFYYLSFLTGDPVYREWGWEAFVSIENHCKAKYGYGELSTVRDIHTVPRDKMESFFLAETLKYLYLLQDPDSKVDILNKHVFNTEAHPMRVFPQITEALPIQLSK